MWVVYAVSGFRDGVRSKAPRSGQAELKAQAHAASQLLHFFIVSLLSAPGFIIYVGDRRPS